MTAREALADAADGVRERLDRILDSEDAVIVLMDRRGTLSFCHGFGASGCQLELVGHMLERALQGLAPVNIEEESCRQSSSSQR
jgi:hypothetical protein